MLAQNFMTAAELGIDNDGRDALIKVLGMLEREELRHELPIATDRDIQFPGDFNMCSWDAVKHGCGTAACIGGWANRMGARFSMTAGGRLDDLFYPRMYDMSAITTAQAAIALRNYLTTGEPRWDEALATS